MSMVIGLPAAGEMGAGLGRVLAEHGARVLTCTEGRSAQTRERAAAAGMESVDTVALASAEVVLSVVPPGIAVETAQRLARHFSGTAPPLYVDGNAVSPRIAREVAAAVEAAGGVCVDGGIIGGPPAPGGAGPRLYVSGAAAERALALRDLGLDVRPVEGGIGAASALKMCYGGLTKGLTGLQAALMLAAEREGVGAALHAELADSQAALLKRAGNAVPGMYPKAYRWVAEMDSISEFIGPEHGESAVWEGLARLYERLAADQDGEGAEIALIDAFLGRGSGG
jgi:L-threonate 2-dehydrogenase